MILTNQLAVQYVENYLRDIGYKHIVIKRSYLTDIINNQKIEGIVIAQVIFCLSHDEPYEYCFDVWSEGHKLYGEW